MEEWLNSQNKAFVNAYIDTSNIENNLQSTDTDYALQGNHLSSFLIDNLASVQTAYMDITKTYLWAASNFVTGIYHHTQYTLLHTNFIHLLSYIITSRYLVRAVYLTHPQSGRFYTTEYNTALLNSVKKAGPVTLSAALQSHQLALHFFKKTIQIYLTPLIIEEVAAKPNLKLRETPHNKAFSSCSPHLYQLGPAVDNKVASEISFVVGNWLQNYSIGTTGSISPFNSIIKGTHFIPMAFTIKYNFSRVMGQYTSMIPLSLDSPGHQNSPPNFSLHRTTDKNQPPRYIMKSSENITLLLFTPIQYLHSLYIVLSHQSQTSNTSNNDESTAKITPKYGFIRESPKEHRAPLVQCYVEAIIRVMHGLCYAHADQVSISTKNRVINEVIQMFIQKVEETRSNALDHFEEDDEYHKVTTWDDVKEAAKTTHSLDDVIELASRAAIIPDCFHNVRIPERLLFDDDLPKVWLDSFVTTTDHGDFGAPATCFQYVYTSSLNDEYNKYRSTTQDLSFDAFALLTEASISYLVDLLLEGNDLCEMIFNDFHTSNTTLDKEIEVVCDPQNEPPHESQIPVAVTVPVSSKCDDSLTVIPNQPLTLFPNISDQILTALMDHDDIYQVLPFIDTIGSNGHINFNQSQFIPHHQNPYQSLANSFKFEDLCTFGPHVFSDIDHVPPSMPIPFPITVTEVQSKLNPAVLELINEESSRFSHALIQIKDNNRIPPHLVNIEVLMQDFATNSIRNERQVVTSYATPCSIDNNIIEYDEDDEDFELYNDSEGSD